ncbi:phosphoribulokinase [Aerosakkonema funiforme]|nr:phosphoribulokinase [Aerosakkonema funiforme]
MKFPNYQLPDLKQTYMDSKQTQPKCITLRSQIAQLKEPIIIGVAGDSGSGKSTYSNGIRRLLGTDLVSTIEMDGYHKEDREQRRISGRLPLDPEANHLDLLRSHLALLKQAKSIEVPIYNHGTGKFDSPVHLAPSPIVVVEGLHALYPEILPLLDFSIYVDPDHDVKWQWKYERDVKKRGHLAEALTEEMLKREAAYKRWIDFQKTNANVVIKIFPSHLKEFSRHEFTGNLPANCYKVELIVEPGQVSLPSLPLPFDFAAMLEANQPPFMLAAVPCTYWGRKVMIIHIDGVLSQDTIATLEKQIVAYTGIPLEEGLSTQNIPDLQAHEQVSATQFAQLLITWRFLELVNHRLSELMAR